MDKFKESTADIECFIHSFAMFCVTMPSILLVLNFFDNWVEHSPSNRTRFSLCSVQFIVLNIMFYKIRFIIKFKFIVHFHDAHQSVQLFEALYHKKIQVIFSSCLFTFGILFIHNIFLIQLMIVRYAHPKYKKKKSKPDSIVI